MGTYAEMISWLYGLEPRGIRLELDRMERFLASRGHPERELAVVHVAGTNGKGSVAVMIEAALRAAGYRTGLYTSPHLHTFGERIRIDGEPLDRAEIAMGLADLRRSLAAPDAPALTFFEVTTALAFEAFRARGVEIVVLEVGLGGRLDATNVVDAPELTVITTIGLDHTDRLGPTLSHVAAEKAGILKPGVPLVCGVREHEAKTVIAQRAAACHVESFFLGDDFVFSEREGEIDVRFGDATVEAVPIRLRGEHQKRNGALAVAALHVLRKRGRAIEDEAIRRGLGHVAWPGRLELLPGAPPVLLDAAHNAEGCLALAAHLDELPRGGPRVLLFGAMTEKDHEAMLSAFDGRVDARVYAVPPMRRATDLRALAAIRPGTLAATVEDGFSHARALAGADGLVVVAGSIFLMAEVRARVLGLEEDPRIGM